MEAAILVVNFLASAVQAGLNMSVVLGQVSDRLKAAHAAGVTVTAADLSALLDQGDALQRDAQARFAQALADPATPAP